MDMSETKAAQAAMGVEVTFPLNVLFRDPLNVRKMTATGIPELAALILSQGLLQNLVVREEVKGKKQPKATGKYGVVAGGRRYAALMLLVSEGKLPVDWPVRCLLVSSPNALAVSVAENSGRQDLHPADQITAFAAMANGGKSVGDIAEAFGVTPLVVQRRLRLADLSPRLLDLYRDEQISSEQLMALALAPDHATQEAVWDNTPAYYRDAANLRRRLTAGEVPADHPAARLIGREAYEAAGGAVRCDLFSPDGADGWLMADKVLLERLVVERLSAKAEELRTEGWAWVEAHVEWGYEQRQKFEYCGKVRRKPTPQEKQKLDALQAELDGIEAKIEALDDDEDSEAFWERQTQLEDEIAVIDQTLSVVDPAQKALAGAVVYLGRAGVIEVDGGLMRKEDLAKLKSQRATTGKTAGHAEGDTEAESTGPSCSERLTRQLTAHRTAAIRACLADDPAVALRVLAFRLGTTVFYESDWSRELDRPVEIRLESAGLAKDAPDYEASPAHECLQNLRVAWGERLPADAAGFLEWVFACDMNDVYSVLAICAAQSINAVQSKEARRPVAARIEKALGLDMRDWWKPTEASYLAAVPKAQILAAVTEAVSKEAAASLAGMKKAELVKAAEAKLENTGWLPSLLRAPQA